MANEFNALAVRFRRVRLDKGQPAARIERGTVRRKEIALSPTKPGEENVVCHYGRKTSPHAYTCRDCQREFYLQCVEVKTPTKAQAIVCPNCGSDNLHVR